MIIKLTHSQIEALLLAFMDWDTQRETGPYGELLIEICYEYLQLLDYYRDKHKKTYRIKFSDMMCLAFIQMWVDKPLPPEPESRVVIQELIGVIDRQHKQVKLLQA